MIIHIAERLACFVECLITVFFLFKYFAEKSKYTIVLSGIFLVVFTIFDIFFSLEPKYSNFMAISYCVLPFLYTCLLSKKDYGIKALICIFNLAILGVISILMYSIFSNVTNNSVRNILEDDTFVRVFFLFVTKLLYLLVIAFILSRRKNQEIQKLSRFEWLFIFGFFCITLAVMLLCWNLILKITPENTEIMEVISLGFVVINSLLYFLLNKISKDNFDREEYHLLKIKTETEIRIYDEISSQYKELSCLRHDLKHHFSVLSDYVHSGNIEEYDKYLSEMIEINNLISSKTIVFTGNEIIDIIMNNKKFIAEKDNITVDFHINVTDKTFFTLYGSQLGIIIANLLDNAVNAAKLSEEKTISLKISNRREHIKITIRNSLSPKNRPDLSCPPKPHGKHGFGILSVKNIVKKLEGTISFKLTDTDFIVNIFI